MYTVYAETVLQSIQKRPIDTNRWFQNVYPQPFGLRYVHVVENTVLQIICSKSLWLIFKGWEKEALESSKKTIRKKAARPDPSGESGRRRLLFGQAVPAQGAKKWLLESKALVKSPRNNYDIMV